jgi:3-isopropylmalate/(R)-2-methylmalate dehydratase large subunit
MKKTGRFLYLTDDAALLQAQLAGDDLAWAGQPLHYGVNTDLIISGAACTLGYTGEVLGPWFLENFKDVVQKDSVRSGGFQVVVAGDAYGSGSSREVAVVAHQGAGIELIVARSFQRIFQENMVYGGMPFTTDFTVLDRLERGDEIDTRGFFEVLPEFFRAVAERGGLLAYGQALLDGRVEPTWPTDRPARPLNAVEKIIARQTWVGTESYGTADVRPGDQVLCRAGFRGVHEYTAGMVVSAYREAFGDAPMRDPDLIAAFEDHFVLIDEPTVPAAAATSSMDSSSPCSARPHSVTGLPICACGTGVRSTASMSMLTRPSSRVRWPSTSTGVPVLQWRG